MVSQVAKWGNSQGIRMEKRLLKSLGMSIGDTVQISKNGKDTIISPIHGIDWYLKDYERPENGWEQIDPERREVW